MSSHYIFYSITVQLVQSKRFFIKPLNGKIGLKMSIYYSSVLVNYSYAKKLLFFVPFNCFFPQLLYLKDIYMCLSNRLFEKPKKPSKPPQKTYMAGIWTLKWNKIKLEVWEKTLIIDYSTLLLHVENKKVPSPENYSCSYELFSLSW